MKVGLGKQGVLADHVYGADRAVEAALAHFGDHHPGPLRWPRSPGTLEAAQARRRVVRVAWEIGGNGARVSTALHVVLAAERRDAGAGEAHLAGGEGEVQQRVRVRRPIDVLGDYHAPDEARTRERRPGIPAGGLSDARGGHPGHSRRGLEGVRLEGGGPRLEAFRSRANEV